MTSARTTLACLLATVALAAAACGGGSDSVPSGSIAVVDGTEISKADLDELIAQAKKGYESQNQDFPKAGTPEYQSIQTQYVAYLVELEELRQAADELGISVSEKDVDAAEEKLIDERFGGKRADYEKALEKQGFTAEQYRENALEVSALSSKIFDEVTKGAKVTDQEILAYYTQNQSQYGTPESRDVRHILIAEKDGDDKVDFEASKAKADEIYCAARRRRRLCGAGEGELGRPGEQGRRREADDHPRPDGSRVRQDLVRARQGRAVEARQDRVRLPRHRGGVGRPQGADDADRQGQAHHPRDASPGEAKRGDASVGRGPEEGLRGQGELRGRLRAAAAPGDPDRDPVGSRSMSLAEALLDLQELTRQLRRECPWDREQTAVTIVPHTVEEAYEVADAALGDDPEALHGELGDLLFQVYFLSLLLEERGAGRPRVRRT